MRYNKLVHFANCSFFCEIRMVFLENVAIFLTSSIVWMSERELVLYNSCCHVNVSAERNLIQALLCHKVYTLSTQNTLLRMSLLTHCTFLSIFCLQLRYLLGNFHCFLYYQKYLLSSANINIYIFL